jgi:hypothetical protein
MSGALKIQE